MAWKDGKLTGATMRSKLGNKCTVRYGTKTISFDTEPGKHYVLNAVLQLQ